jgi:hypothetical protein
VSSYPRNAVALFGLGLGWAYHKQINFTTFYWVGRMVDVGCKAAMTSDKLKNLGWRPMKLEEMLADSVESYEKAGLLQVSDGEPCRLPFFYRMPPVQE